MSGKPIPAEKMPRVIGSVSIKDDPHFSEPRPLLPPLFQSSEFDSSDALRTGFAEAMGDPNEIIEYRAPGELPPPDPHQSYTTVDRIKCYIRTLTHREMRELAADLFGAYERLHPQVEPTVIKAAIPREALAEVLDRFAHND